MYELDYTSQTSYVSDYFCCRIRLEGLLYSAQRDLLATDTFLVSVAVS